MKKEMPVSTIKGPALLLLISLLLLACSVFDKKSYLKEVDHSVYYTGKVTREVPGIGPIIVALYAEQEPKQVLAYDVVPKEGAYHLVAGEGSSSRRILAFEDANGNFIYDHGEKIGYLKTPLVNARKERTPKARAAIVVPASGGEAPGFSIDLSVKNVALAVTERKSRIGAEVTLGDSRFCDENGELGYLNPHAFLEELGPSLYRLKGYNPELRPIILVHGIKGSPASLSDIASHIDKTRYQVWVYFWPTGMPINFSAWFLIQALEEMGVGWKFEHIDIIAHSMGGLMSRAAVNMKPLPVDRFITISTPWNGHAAAKLGVTMSPVIIPSWEDMAPGSHFLDHLFDTPLPASTRHVLLFSYQGMSLFTSGNDDGCVSIESMLFEEAQKRASLVNGFNADHTAVLSWPGLLEVIEFELRQPVEQRGAGGYAGEEQTGFQSGRGEQPDRPVR